MSGVSTTMLLVLRAACEMKMRKMFSRNSRNSQREEQNNPKSTHDCNKHSTCISFSEFLQVEFQSSVMLFRTKIGAETWFFKTLTFTESFVLMFIIVSVSRMVERRSVSCLLHFCR